jgi:hypothetical protein
VGDRLKVSLLTTSTPSPSCVDIPVDPLTERDRAATDLAEAFNLDAPRDAASVPPAAGRPVPAADPRLDRPLTPLQRALVSTLMYAAGRLPEEAALRSARHALIYLDNHAGALGAGGTPPQTVHRTGLTITERL